MQTLKRLETEANKQVESAIETVRDQVRKTPSTVTETVEKERYGLSGGFEEITKRNPKMDKLTGKGRRLQSISGDREKTIATLEEKGIDYIAILPTKIWGELCKKFNLYRFTNITKRGTVEVKNDSSFRKYTGIQGVIIGTIISVLTLPFIAGIIIPDASEGAFIASVFASISLAIGIGYLVFKAIQYHRAHIMSTAEEAEMLWGDTHKAYGISHSRGNTVEVSFNLSPEVSSEFIDLLDSLDSNEIVADPEAFEINNPRSAPKGDPIVCYQHYEKGRESNCIAILRQFGDFPAEEEVVEWVQKFGKKILMN